jgi:hypothetical protein
LKIDSDTINFIHTKRIITKQRTIRIWQKLIRLNEEDKNSDNIDLQKYSNSARTQVLWEFNCKEEMMKIVSLVHYSEGGKFVNYQVSNKGWSAIPPSSTGEAMMKIACKK